MILNLSGYGLSGHTGTVYDILLNTWLGNLDIHQSIPNSACHHMLNTECNQTPNQDIIILIWLHVPKSLCSTTTINYSYKEWQWKQSLVAIQKYIEARITEEPLEKVTR